MEISVKFKDVEIVADPKPVTRDGHIVHYADVLFLGGKARVSNPNKFSGRFVECIVAARIDSSASVWRDKETGQYSALSRANIRYGGIIEALKEGGKK